MAEIDAVRCARDIRDLLRNVRQRAGPTFSGIGVLVCDEPDRLPLIPLRPSSAPPLEGATADILAVISRSESDYHDGFHVLSSDLRLKLVSQFFSPPPQSHLAIDRSKPIGGRYLAAQLGSVLPGVLLTGIASVRLGVAIFIGGAEKLYEPVA